MFASIQSFFAMLLAIVQLLCMMVGIIPLSDEPVSYGGGAYTETVIAEPYNLVEDGASAYVIVLAADASETERTAAQYLQEYIQKISGAQLPIQTDAQAAGAYEICLGNTNRTTPALQAETAKLIDEGFVKRMEGNTLFITGMGERGTIYGVSSFLEEQLGCRFFTPELYTIPSNPTIVIDKQLDDLQNPYFSYREVLWRVGFKSTEWKLFHKINSSFGSYQPANYGGGISYADFCHSMERLVPDALYAEHPEYFSYREKEGTRTLHQRCLSNPEVLRIAIESARQCIIDHPDAQIMSITQNDNTEYCQCAECAAWDAYYESPAGLNIWFVNEVAKVLGPEFEAQGRMITFDTLAYQYTRQAPKHIAPAENVVVRLCSIECCFVHPLSQCGHERGEDLIEHVQEKESTFARDIAQWSKLTENLWVWNYTTNYKLNQLPHPNFHTLAGDLQWFLENNVKGVFEQGNNDDLHSGEFGEMRAYILAKLLWNPYANVEQMMMEFMNAYYGEASAPYIKQYLDAITKKTAETAHLFCFNWQNEGAYFTGIETAKMDKLWNNAEKNAATEEQSTNIQRSRLQLRVYKACLLQGEFSLLNPKRIEENKRLLEDMLALGITQMTSGKNIEIPEGLDWILRPAEWIDLGKVFWNK